jgi:hypothetical protein
MASSSKKRTTMAKLNRENSLREKRVKKQQRRDERKRTPAEDAQPLIAPISTPPEAGVDVEAA